MSTATLMLLSIASTAIQHSKWAQCLSREQDIPEGRGTFISKLEHTENMKDGGKRSMASIILHILLSWYGIRFAAVLFMLTFYLQFVHPFVPCINSITHWGEDRNVVNPNSSRRTSDIGLINCSSNFNLLFLFHSRSEKSAM